MSNQVSPGAVGAVGAGKLPTAWIAGGTLAVVSIAAAAAMVLRPSALPAPPAAPVATMAAAQPARAEPAAKPVTPAPAARPAPRPAKVPAGDAVAKASSVCSYCGVVESVVAVKRKGEGTGLGVVAGGVLGAVVGHQMGNGNGKKAMTVIGGVAGGVAGNEVEKHARGDTVYQVRVRMDDDTERTVEQAEAPHVGARVNVQGNTLKALHTAG